MLNEEHLSKSALAYKFLDLKILKISIYVLLVLIYRLSSISHRHSSLNLGLIHTSISHFFLAFLTLHVYLLELFFKVFHHFVF